MRAVLIAASLIGCSSVPPPTVVERSPSGADSEGHRGHVAVRKGEVPKPTDPKERVVFLRAGSVWMTTAEGKEPEQLTVRGVESGHEDPALSPDGRRLAFISPTKGAYQLVVMDVQELMPKVLTDENFGQAGQPAWSPDGKHLAVMRGDFRDKRDLMIIPSTGGGARLLVEGNDDMPQLAGAPCWSPDGKSIVFAADQRLGKGTLLWHVDVKTGTLSPLTRGRKDGSHFRDRFPTFTPDGKTIVFASNRHISSRAHTDDDEIYAADASGKSVVRLTDGKGHSTDPAVSPDGKRVYFTSTREAKAKFESEVFIMSVEGGAAVRLTSDPQPQNRAPSAATVK